MMRWVRLAGALIICALGGYLFTLIKAPAPWLAGSMLATLPLLAAGAGFDIPWVLRDAVFLLLGTQIGAAVNWGTVASMGRWPLSLLFLALTVTAIIVNSMSFFRRGHGWDGPTAFFAAVPGALSLVLLVAMKAKADMARVTVVQSFRLVLTLVGRPAIADHRSRAGRQHRPPRAGQCRQRPRYRSRDCRRHRRRIPLRLVPRSGRPDARGSACQRRAAPRASSRVPCRWP